MAKRGIFGSAVIKKQRYWPKHINGDQICDYFEGKPVGAVDALPGTLEHIPFHNFCLKEEDYTMMVMSTYGTMGLKDKTNRFLEATKEKVSFHYTKVFSNHFCGRHAVDDSYKCCIQPISLEETWQTSNWENCVFAYFMGTAAANAQYAYQYFSKHKQEPVLAFC